MKPVDFNNPTVFLSHQARDREAHEHAQGVSTLIIKIIFTNTKIRMNSCLVHYFYTNCKDGCLENGFGTVLVFCTFTSESKNTVQLRLTRIWLLIFEVVVKNFCNGLKHLAFNGKSTGFYTHYCPYYFSWQPKHRK